jgi:fructose-bisphosphate aldolase, class I
VVDHTPSAYVLDSGTTIRSSRIVRSDGRALVGTVAHGLLRGSIPGEGDPRELGRMVSSLGQAGLDAIVTSPGFLRQNARWLSGRAAPGIVLCLDWTNQFRGEEDLGYPEGRSTSVASVDDAVRLGADAVMTYLFLGSEDAEVEAREVDRNARISRRCEELGIVRIIETMARGSRVPIDEERAARYVSLHSRIAAEIGCEFVKTEWTGSAATFSEVTRDCPVPVLVAGGPKAERPEDAVGMARLALDAGAVGVVYGRNIVQAPDPASMVRALAEAIHS